MSEEFLRMSQPDARELARRLNFQVGCKKASDVPINPDSLFAVLIDYGVICKHPDKMGGDQCIYVQQTGDEQCPFSGITPISKDWIERWNASIAAATINGVFTRSAWVAPENE